MDKNHKNVLGQPLVSCGKDPLTGYYRDGFCATGPEDTGVHVVCAQMTLEFLEFSKSRGNDLMTSQPASGFKGLKAGDRWCLCASRWKEAFNKNLAPPVILESTHENALKIVTLENLKNTCLK